MPRDSVLRLALLASVAYNAVGATALLLPTSPFGRLAGLPATAPFLYRMELAWVVGLFGALYAWIARRPSLDATVVPLVVLSAIGKAGFFAVYVLAWVGGETTPLAVASASGDLWLALVFAWWVAARRGAASVAPAR
jgi:hypothetical protein